MKNCWLFAVLYACFVVTVPALELLETYASPRTILFAATIGGSSHVNWVLEILQQLEERGHTTAFVTRDDHTRFGKKYGIDTVSIGPSAHPSDTQIEVDNAHLEPRAVMGTLISRLINAYPQDYQVILQLMKDKKVDLAICDHFVDPCMEAALQLKIPFVITSTLAIAPDARAPYVSGGIGLYGVHNGQVSFWERVYYDYLFTASFLWSHFDTLMELPKVKQSLGLAAGMDTMATWKHALKLVNTIYGLENARPTGPLVEFVGPIMPRTYTSLSAPYDTFLAEHVRVMYVAFGQRAIPSLVDRQLLWTALMTLLETGTIDGLVWVDAHFDEMPATFAVKTANRTYTRADIAANPDILISVWAPQMAILRHASTAAFLTHGGTGSLQEALYALKPMAVFPFFGDQMGLARNVEYQGCGVFLDRDSPASKIAAQLTHVATNDTVRARARQLGTLVQINAKHGAQRGADLVEEVLFTFDAERGILPARHEAAFDLPFWVTYNLDVYLFFATLLVMPVLVLRYAYRLMVAPCMNRQAKIKTH
ncbi:hypothetical protein BC940DRAFT_333788 [Gongronella butleri]|nr:hypothetical protein BC940DRAFT_333788 [Gongronella butleri]